MSSNLTRRISPTSASTKAHAAFLSSRESRESARAELPSIGAGLGRGTVADDNRCAPAAAQPCAGARPSPLSLIPIRLALPITAFRDAAPSARAMTLALLPSSASLLRTSTASSVHSISTTPCSPPPARAGARWDDPERAYSIRRRSRGRRAVTARRLMMKILLISISCLEMAAAQSRISNCPRRRLIRYVCGVARIRLNHISNEGRRHVRRRFGAGEVRGNAAVHLVSDVQDVHRRSSRARRSFTHRPQRVDPLFRRGRHAAHARASVPRSH